MYNTVNQRTKTTLADDSYWDYTYDDLGQVTSGRKYTSAGTPISGRQSVYDQDEIGNRVTSSTPGYVPYTVNDDNQYTVMKDVSLTYDPAGNLLTNGSWTYSWDNENRLTQVVSTSKLIQFTYDTQGRRIEKKVWNNTTGTGTPATYLKYIYDGWNLIAELNGKSSDAVVRTYSWGPEAQGVPGTLRMIADNNGVYFPAYDPNGNVMGLVKASDGTVCAQYEYLPYGELVTATGTIASSNPIRFSTKYRDNETGLYYYGYRYYSPDMGRWISRDPIEERGGLNLYGFVNNDPVNFCDLSGMTDYKLGTLDPPYEADTGSGEWGQYYPLILNQNFLFDYTRNEAQIVLLFLRLGYPDAAAHLSHYFGNSGTDYYIRFEKMLSDDTDAYDDFLEEAKEAKDFAESVKTPSKYSFLITSRAMTITGINKDKDKNWFYAVGGYRVWGKGIVEVCGDNYKLYFEYKFRDRYNWDDGKEAKIWGIPIKDKQMGFFHKIGLAKEFNMYGSVKRTISWKKKQNFEDVKKNIKKGWINYY